VTEAAARACLGLLVVLVLGFLWPLRLIWLFPAIVLMLALVATFGPVLWP
jgi:hypothetical protein